MHLPAANDWHETADGPEDRDRVYELWEIIEAMADRIDALEDEIMRHKV